MTRWLVLLGLLVSGPAYAHDQWANGAKIPEWVKLHCCNSNEAHDLTLEMKVEAGQITSRQGGAMSVSGGNISYIYYRVPGFENEVNATNVFPSQDGHVWAFYANGGPPQATIWCLFVPCVSNERMPQELDGSCS